MQNSLYEDESVLPDPFPLYIFPDTFILKSWGSRMCDMEGDRDMFKNKKLDHIWALFFSQNFLINIFSHANKSIFNSIIFNYCIVSFCVKNQSLIIGQEDCFQIVLLQTVF